MLHSITIKHFKSVEKVEDLELGLVNVFIGANGAGKSNILEALGVLAAAANGRVDDESLLRRGVRPGAPSLYKSAFPGGGSQKEIRFGVKTSHASYDVGLFNPTTNPWPAWHFHTEKLIGNDELIVGRSHRTKDKKHPEAGEAALKILDLEPNHPAAQLMADLRNFAIYSPNTQTLRALVPDPQQREPVGLAGGQLAVAVGELIRELGVRSELGDVRSEIFSLIPWARFFSVRGASAMPLSPAVPTSAHVLRFVDRYMRDGRNAFTAYDASEGALYVLFTAVLALHPKAPRILAIDNADHGLNPLLARRLMEYLCRWILAASTPRQILMTTHNPLVLDGLPLQDDRVRLFVVDRSRLGKTVVERFQVTPEILDRAKDGWTLSRLWLSGHLGGIPSGI